MMYGELYQYLVLHKQLNIPGIGTFQLERKPATIDFVGKVVNPPAYLVALHHGNVAPSKKIFSWLAEAFDISERDALSKFNDFAFEIRDKLMAGDRLYWDGLGTLSKGMAGEIRFDADLKAGKSAEAIPAQKIIRENSEHAVRVGEEEKTSTEMRERLATVKTKRTYWWVAALILGLLAIIFLIWYFSSKGLHTSSTGNQQKLKPRAETATYKLSS